jgi:hypothetical protein
MVSRRGRRDLKQQGQRNLSSLDAAATSCWAGVCCLFLLLLLFGSGTHVAVTQQTQDAVTQLIISGIHSERRSVNSFLNRMLTPQTSKFFPEHNHISLSDLCK